MAGGSLPAHEDSHSRRGSQFIHQHLGADQDIGSALIMPQSLTIH